MKVLITGAAGQIGGAIAREFEPCHRVIGLGQRELDITDHASVTRVVQSERPDVVINCAAYNDVEAAEDEALTALQVNAFAVGSLARAAREAGAALVHFSTDFVFDGETTRPYVETDPPNPRSVYAASKLLGDWFAAELPRAYVLRVESLFGPCGAKGGRKSSVDRIIAAIQAGAEARVFVDRVVSPSYAVDVAATTRALVERGVEGGLYHCVNSGFCTWLDLGLEIVRLLGAPCTLVPVRTADVPLRASRPRFSALSNAKLARVGLAMPSWQDALARCLAARVG
jgi:dTDP-4-dehydrorhamnose reductase